MNLRSRAKSLPSMRQAAQCQTSPSIPDLPPLRGRFAVDASPKIVVETSAPAWDRQVDIVFHRSPIRYIEGTSTLPKVLDVALGVTPQEAATGRTSDTTDKTRNLESHTYAAIVSILNYADKIKDPKDSDFQRAIYILHRARGGPIGNNETCVLSRLPERVRRRIWSHVISENAHEARTPVRLQLFKPFFKDVWKAADFQSTKELFSLAEGVMSTSFAMRTELLAHVLTTHRFHLVFSPYVKERICPQLFDWIDRYSHIMEHVTIELDLSKLGLGPTPEASDLLWGNRNIITAMRHFADIQSINRTAPLESLVLLARRYYGLRPKREDDTDAGLYCPPSADLSAAAPIIRLKNQINTLRIAGFNATTTETLITSLFPAIDFKNKEILQNHCSRALVSKVWPFLPNQRSIHLDVRFSKAASRPQRAVSTTIIPVRSASLARKQIVKVKDTLETYDAKKDSTPPLSRRPTARTPDHSRELEQKRCDSVVPSIPPISRLGSDEDLPSHTLLSTSQDVITCTSTTQVTEMTQAKGSLDTPEEGSPKKDDCPSRLSILADNASKRGSQASSGSLRSKRSVRWHNDTVSQRLSKDSAQGIAEDIPSVPVGQSSRYGAGVFNTLKKMASTKELRRKKSIAN
ncbi:hypothetical protein SCAR479_12555 [Seiridium cardinale]|uniref:Uncharacterized protein n=1 Tax=Seiridium cardinale TaxID=138064 RepID=A0ABR2XAE9_9PEZI